MQSFDNVRIVVHHDLLGIECGEPSSILYSEEESKDGAECGQVLVNNHNNQI
jgi:hypothetical protein